MAFMKKLNIPFRRQQWLLKSLKIRSQTSGFLLLNKESKWQTNPRLYLVLLAADALNAAKGESFSKKDYFL
jgi:hypothetical protein